MPFNAKDFVETGEGLGFAIVDSALVDGRLPVYLRYQRGHGGLWCKLSTADANAVLSSRYPDYLRRCMILDTSMQSVPLTAIHRHYPAHLRLLEMQSQATDDVVVRSAVSAARMLYGQGLDPQSLGISGSVLIGAHRTDSDIDLVVYGRQEFLQARSAVRRLCRTGQLASLEDKHWRQAFARRRCALDFDTYLFHERRKGNKFLVDGRKVDISLVPLPNEQHSGSGPYRKMGSTTITARVDDDRHGFDLPARYGIIHPRIAEIWVFTATYVGQVRTGETIEAAGQLERDRHGVHRLIIGNDRESAGQYLKTLR